MNNYMELNIRELYYNCCDNKEVFLNNMLYLRDKYNRRIHNITSYTPYDINHFMHNLRFDINKDKMISNVRLSSNDLLKGICNLLDIDNTDLKDEDIIKLINENIEKLKNIKDKSLKKKYPKLYDMFQQGLGMYHKWSSLEFLDQNNPDDKELIDRLSKLRSEYFSYGFRYSYDKFTDTQADYLERLVKHKDDIKKYCDNNSNVNDIYFNGLNKDKLNLYLFYKYIDKIKNCNDEKFRFELLDILKNNINKIIGLDDKITIFKNVNKTSLLAEYVVLNRKYGIPKLISVEAALLPSSEDKNKKGTGRVRTYRPLTDEERQELININKKKKDFYNNSGYVTVINEKEGLTGYSAFVYPNGHILEDYIADEESDSSLKNNKKNAVYHVDIYGFEYLLDLVKDGKGKLEVKRDKRCHGTFNHTGDWVSRLQEVVDIESNDDVFADTKHFIKRLVNNKKSI